MVKFISFHLTNNALRMHKVHSVIICFTSVILKASEKMTMSVSPVFRRTRIEKYLSLVETYLFGNILMFY